MYYENCRSYNNVAQLKVVDIQITVIKSVIIIDWNFCHQVVTEA